MGKRMIHRTLAGSHARPHTRHARVLALTPRTSEYAFDAKALDFARRYPMAEPSRFAANRISPHWRPGRRERALSHPASARLYCLKQLFQLLDHMRHVTNIIPDVCTAAATTKDHELWARVFAARMLAEDALALAVSAQAYAQEMP